MYKQLGYNWYIHKPENKDFNEDLIEELTKQHQLNEDEEMER